MAVLCLGGHLETKARRMWLSLEARTAWPPGLTKHLGCTSQRGLRMEKTMFERASMERHLRWESFCRSCVQGQGETCRNKPREDIFWEPVPTAGIFQLCRLLSTAVLPFPSLPDLSLGRMEGEEHILDVESPLWKAFKSSFHPLLFTGSVEFCFNQGWVRNWLKQPVSVGNSTTLPGAGMGG